MRSGFAVWVILSVLLGCAENYSDLPQMSVDFIWPNQHKCFDRRSPEIMLQKIPGSTESFLINMADIDNHYNHGGGTFVFDGSTVIPEGALAEYQGPCPSYGSPRFRLTVKAINKNGEVIAFGEKTKKYPPLPE